jgi:hypothetical protein
MVVEEEARALFGAAWSRGWFAGYSVVVVGNHAPLNWGGGQPLVGPSPGGVSAAGEFF